MNECTSYECAGAFQVARLSHRDGRAGTIVSLPHTSKSERVKSEALEACPLYFLKINVNHIDVIAYAVVIDRSPYLQSNISRPKTTKNLTLQDRVDNSFV